MGRINKNKINIFFCINDLQKGGAEKQLNYISNYLSEKYNIFIFTVNKNKIKYRFNNRVKIYNLSGFFAIFIFLKKIFYLKPKIVFFILPKAYFFFGTILIFFPNIKKILMRRSLNYYHKNLTYRYYEIFLHQFIDLIICNSNAAKFNLINSEFVQSKKVLVINNYIQPLNTLVKGKNTKEFRILCISNFYRYKGHLLLLKSLKHIKNFKWKLYMIGEERDFKKKEIIDYAKKFGILGKIKFLKKVKYTYSFPNFKLGIILSKTESFPNAVLEYLLLRLPVIATNVGDMNRLVDSNNGFLIKNRKPKLISNKIEKLISDKKLKKKSFYSKNKLKKYTDKNNTLEKYNKLIKKILCVE